MCEPDLELLEKRLKEYREGFEIERLILRHHITDVTVVGILWGTV